MIFVIGGAFQDKTEFVKNKFNADEKDIYNNFHLKIRECMENNKDISEIAETAAKYKYVVCDEVGSGIIPINKFDREWRETVGRESCKMAAAADEVWRVVCGIGQRIK